MFQKGNRRKLWVPDRGTRCGDLRINGKTLPCIDGPVIDGLRTLKKNIRPLRGYRNYCCYNATTRSGRDRKDKIETGIENRRFLCAFPETVQYAVIRRCGPRAERTKDRKFVNGFE